MRNLFLTVDEASDLIRSGAAMFVSGAEALLAGLPRGKWIGGTTAYFVTENGASGGTDRIFCTVIDEALRVRSDIVGAHDLGVLVARRFDRGFACIVAPAFSPVHERYAIEGQAIPGLFDQPVFGWVAGVALDRIGTDSPKVFDGATGRSFTDGLATLWVETAEGATVDLDIVNLFVPGDGDTIVFPETGFSATACLVNGKPANLAAYLRKASVDTRIPLVADHAGAMINVSFESVDDAKGEVRFYAPVTAGTKYRLAKPVADAEAVYADASRAAPPSSALSCNCILNYLYGDLETGGAGGFTGPVTFGEFAYILLNQTMPRLVLKEVAATRPRELEAA